MTENRLADMSDPGARSSAKPKQILRPPLFAALALVASGGPLLAHAVVYPLRSTPGAYEMYVLRVPNERNVATTRIEIAFPPEVRVVSFADVMGWELEVLSDASGRVTGAVWTGELPVGRFVELPFVAVNPSSSARLAWRTDQTYAGGDVVAWSGPEESATPASFTMIDPERGGSPPASLILSGAALAVSLLALGLAFRWRSGN